MQVQAKGVHVYLGLHPHTTLTHPMYSHPHIHAHTNTHNPALTQTPTPLQHPTNTYTLTSRVFNATDLVMLGVGCTVGAGIMVLTGVAARDTAGWVCKPCLWACIRGIISQPAGGPPWPARTCKIVRACVRAGQLHTGVTHIHSHTTHTPAAGCADAYRPGVVISYAIAGFAALLSSLCYAEFAADIPVAGGAFNYIGLT
eukprot:1137155-Pelagomonas_calceolata.AAC.3